MEKFFWAISALCSIAGAFIFIGGLTAANSAPQEASIAAMALATAAIPYCFARAISQFKRAR